MLSVIALWKCRNYTAFGICSRLFQMYYRLMESKADNYVKMIPTKFSRSAVHIIGITVRVSWRLHFSSCSQAPLRHRDNSPLTSFKPVVDISLPILTRRFTKICSHRVMTIGDEGKSFHVRYQSPQHLRRG